MKGVHLQTRGLLLALTVFSVLGFVVGIGIGIGMLSSVSSPKPLPTVQDLSTLPPVHDLLRFRSRCNAQVPHHQVKDLVIKNMHSNTNPYTDFPSPHTSSLLLRGARPVGWGSQGQVFADLIESVRPLIIIELGSFLGASAIHMSSVARNLSLPSTLILCLDDFRGWPGFQSELPRGSIPPHNNGDSLLLEQFMLNVVQSGSSENIMPVPFSTQSGLAALCEWGVYGDLIEVDAGHDFHSAWADINMAYAVLRPGGVLFGHDYFMKADERGVRRAVNLFAKVNGLEVTAHGQHWVMSPKPEI